MSEQSPMNVPSAFGNADADDRADNCLGTGNGNQRQGRKAVGFEQVFQPLGGKKKQDQSLGKTAIQATIGLIDIRLLPTVFMTLCE